MLGKLMKYEWKSIYKVECIILSVVIAFTMVGAALINTPIINTLLEEADTAHAGLYVISFFSLIATAIMYIVVLIGASYGSFIYQGVHFYKSMYSDEGYLSHTLPVSSHELLLSKVIINTIWSLIMGAAVIVSVAVIVFSFAHTLGYDPSYQQLMEDIGDTISIVTERGAGVALHWIIYVVVAFILSPMANICALFGALTIGQLSGKRRGLLGIIIYFAITFITNIIGSMAQTVGAAMLYGGLDDVATVSLHLEQFFSRDIKFIITVLVGVILYFVSHYIISEKLNLQ
jgi:hypothetical protein